MLVKGSINSLRIYYLCPINDEYMGMMNEKQLVCHVYSYPGIDGKAPLFSRLSGF